MSQAAAVPGWAVPLQPPGVGPSGRLAGADLEDCCLAAWEAGPSITPLLQGEAVGGVGESGGLLGRGVTLGSATARAICLCWKDLTLSTEHRLVPLPSAAAGIARALQPTTSWHDDCPGPYCDTSAAAAAGFPGMDESLMLTGLAVQEVVAGEFLCV